MPVLPSYRNKSIDLNSKSVDWFLYDGNTGIPNETLTHACFLLHSHTISYPNKQLLVQSQQQKRENKVWKALTDVSMVSLSPIPNITANTTQRPYRWLN